MCLSFTSVNAAQQIIPTEFIFGFRAKKCSISEEGMWSVSRPTLHEEIYHQTNITQNLAAPCLLNHPVVMTQ